MQERFDSHPIILVAYFARFDAASGIDIFYESFLSYYIILCLHKEPFCNALLDKNPRQINKSQAALLGITNRQIILIHGVSLPFPIQ